ncbi:MAG TPA: hypothetical protein VM638_02015 [Actinomycetota bacterium]|nr:hypothetical protein [Actinomycetota bacterium]
MCRISEQEEDPTQPAPKEQTDPGLDEELIQPGPDEEPVVDPSPERDGGSTTPVRPGPGVPAGRSSTPAIAPGAAPAAASAHGPDTGGSTGRDTSSRDYHPAIDTPRGSLPVPPVGASGMLGAAFGLLMLAGAGGGLGAALLRLRARLA